jgi:hypothetical protein
MLTEILICIAVFLVVLVVVIARQPADFQVIRNSTIGAVPATVFAHVNDFRRWEAWSPWEKLDPGLDRIYEGPSAGAGAIYRWAGNHQVGQGNMTITESHAHERIEIRLQFLKPFACINAVEFTFRPENGQTAVTWRMDGHNNFIAKAIHLVVNMDRMVGGQFEQGLAQLKSVAEAELKKTAAALALPEGRRERGASQF